MGWHGGLDPVRLDLELVGVNRDEYLLAPVLYAKRGADLPHSKLDEGTVRAIRDNKLGMTAKQWANKLGLHYRTIEKVRYFESWRHVL